MDLKDGAKKLKTDIPAIFLSLKDKETPIAAKIFACITVAYALSPIDLIPDFIPVLGYLDDAVLLPMFVVDIMGQGAPYFCKLICPAGTLEGGLPLVLLNKSMRSAVGWLYIWKNVILVIMIILAILIYRPFCKYICPLGAFYSIFNKVSVFRYRVDEEKCIHCGKCAKACQMEVNPVENPNSAECIRCGRCKKACPTQAIQCGVKR